MLNDKVLTNGMQGDEMLKETKKERRGDVRECPNDTGSKDGRKSKK